MLRLIALKAMFSRVVVAAYLVVGLLVANSHHYLHHLDGAKRIVWAALAVVLWPLVLFGVDLRIK